MISLVVNVGNIHELRYFICFDIKNIREEAKTNSIHCTKSIFLDAFA